VQKARCPAVAGLDQGGEAGVGVVRLSDMLDRAEASLACCGGLTMASQSLCFF